MVTFSDILYKFPHGLNGKCWSWIYLSSNENLPLEFVKMNPDLPWQWFDIIHHPQITTTFILEHRKYFLAHEVDIFHALSRCSDLTEEIIAEYSEKLNWVVMSEFVNPSMLDFSKVCWKNLSKNQLLGSLLINRYQHLLNWNYLSSHHLFTSDRPERVQLIDAYQDRLNWNILTTVIQLDANILLRYLSRWKLSMLVINTTFTLELFKLFRINNPILSFEWINNGYHLFDAEMIRTYSELNLINWSRISQFIILTPAIITEFLDKWEWSYVSINESITSEIIAVTSERLDFDLLACNLSLTPEDMILYSVKFNKFHLSSHPHLTVEVIDYFHNHSSLSDPKDDSRISELRTSEDEMDSESSDSSEGWSREDRWRWSQISKNLHFTETQVHRYRRELDWYNLSQNDTIDIGIIITSPWLPWNAQGLSRRNYQDLPDNYFDDLIAYITDHVQLIEIRPILDATTEPKLLEDLRIPDLITLSLEDYSFLCSADYVSDLIDSTSDNYEKIKILIPHIQGIVKIKETTPDKYARLLEKSKIEYGYNLGISYPTIERVIESAKQENIIFTNNNNSNDLFRNYLDYRDISYVMNIEGTHNLREHKVPSKGIIKATRKSKGRAKLKCLIKSLKDGDYSNLETLVNIIICHDKDMIYCTQPDFQGYWGMVDLSRITNYKALDYACQLGLDVDLLHHLIERITLDKETVIISKILIACSRFAWYCQAVIKEDVEKLISLICYNQRINYYVFDTLIILSLRKLINLSDYTHLHPQIELLL